MERISLNTFIGFGSKKENLKTDFWAKIKDLTNNFEFEEIKLDSFNENFNVFSNLDQEIIKNHKLYLYFPYSEYHDWELNEKVTISWDPIVSEHMGKGYVVNLKNPEFNEKNNVLVDEEYTKRNPTIIILPQYIEDVIDSKKENQRLNSLNTFRIKEMRIVNNWRSGIFTSAYDMEAKYLSVNYSTPTPTGVLQTAKLGKVTKKDARNKTWKSVNLDLIQNWRENETGYHFVIYHNGSGSYELTMTNQVKGANGEWLTSNLTTTVKIPSKSDNVTVNQIFDRSYMKILSTGGKVNPDQSMHNGRAIHSFSRMEFTYDWYEN
ncbi:hypothetical protein MM236_19485 [Belliella sp. DSM 107340]|uniref:Uncharacterized protein n=1 Tax=Belliella calami TaxID=2923436 RepID=A0ABS9UUT8_9BACT|nr:hypothetical protein [Belliella calami]MCH7400185.1 hypothetical protein [Belliella calami]